MSRTDDRDKIHGANIGVTIFQETLSTLYKIQHFQEVHFVNRLNFLIVLSAGLESIPNFDLLIFRQWFIIHLVDF